MMVSLDVDFNEEKHLRVCIGSVLGVPVIRKREQEVLVSPEPPS